MPLTPNVLPRLLPKNVVAVELCDDVTEILYPEEEHFIARAVNKRVREFTTVRACARLALERLDLRRPVQVPGPRGEPTWPTGIVGAMTHCQGYRAATVARASDFHSLGIDASRECFGRSTAWRRMGTVDVQCQRIRFQGVVSAGKNVARIRRWRDHVQAGPHLLCQIAPVAPSTRVAGSIVARDMGLLAQPSCNRPDR